MADRLKRVSFTRLAVVMAVLAFPLLAVGTAQAAIAGANPESTTNRPDLISATALNSSSVDFCFDKQLNNVNFGTPAAGANFLLGGYRAGRTVTATTALLEQTVDTTGKCVRAIYPLTGAGAIGDIGQYTIGTVLPGSVQSTAGVTNPTGTLRDSTALTVPASLNPTHNGTAGFTVTPDLVGVLPDPTTNTITYTEDQAISTAAAPAAANFQFTRSGGTVCTGTGTPVVTGNQVTVLFAPVATCPVSDAARAGQLTGAMFAAADPGIPSTPDQAIVPGSTGTTALPDLVSTALEPDASAVDYTFDKNVFVNNAAGFDAVLSDGLVLPSTSASVIGPSSTSTTIRVTFPGVTPVAAEYVVKGEVRANAVRESSPPQNMNQFDVRPAGDNAGAFARGFTTGADVFNATINTTTGVVTLGLDQRIFGGDPTQISLLDSTGNIVATAPAGSLTFPLQLPGPEKVQVQFSPGQTSTAKNVSVQIGGLTTAVDTNVPQILSDVSASTVLRSATLHKAQPKHYAAARRAQAKAKEKALAAKLLRSLRKAH